MATCTEASAGLHGLGGAAAILLVLVLALGTARAHEDGPGDPVIIDTDLGLDDVAALALALQSPDLEVEAVVAADGVASGEVAEDLLRRLLHHFNRPDIRLFGPSQEGRGSHDSPRPAEVEASLKDILRYDPAHPLQPFSPSAFTSSSGPVTVLALGPLTNIAAAVREDANAATAIRQVLVSGGSGGEDGWNLRSDPEAVRVLRTAGVPLVFVDANGAAAKPAAWASGRLRGTQMTSLGEELLTRMLSEPVTADHYLGALGDLQDELAVLYLLEPDGFAEVETDLFEPRDGHDLIALFEARISRGRQRKTRVVLTDGDLPDTILRADVREHSQAIVNNNGPDEWFAQLLLNELHEHLGAYSIIGVKMGLRAAELLNAPQHAMEIVSHTPSTQPVSCLNDGLLVATGCTPGRGLFRHEPGERGVVRATFSYNGRNLALELKPEYRERIAAAIGSLRKRYSLSDDAYWTGVRRLGLEIWERWHRRNLFTITGTEPDRS